jgi:hypothetical protein
MVDTPIFIARSFIWLILVAEVFASRQTPFLTGLIIGRCGGLTQRGGLAYTARQVIYAKKMADIGRYVQCALNWLKYIIYKIY